jgi:hypothetical protein
MPRVRFSLASMVALVLVSCRPQADAPPRAGVSQDPAPPLAGPVDSLPLTGIAVSDSLRAWCAEFVVDSAAPALKSGRRVAIVFAGPATVPALRARLGHPRPGECPAEFAQPRWIDYAAYSLELLDSVPDSTSLPSVALVVATEATWSRGADGVVRADLDGDGRPEEARRCTADEGEHFTVWSPRPGGGRVRRWHEYYDWGGFTDPTCKPGEDGGEPTASPDTPASRRTHRLPAGVETS